MKKHQKEPDRWASAFAYASLQIIERTVGEVGLDRKRIKEMLDATEFSTVAGPIKFTKGVNTSTPGMVGQWQKGEFEIVWPRASRPRPPWCPSRPGPDGACTRRSGRRSPSRGF